MASDSFGTINTNAPKEQRGEWRDGVWEPEKEPPPPPPPGWGNFEDGVWNPYATPPPKPPDNQLDTQRKKMMEEAKTFREGLGGYKERQYSSAANLGRDNLETNLRTIRGAANQRGMLFSGLRAGAEGGARANMASLLAQQRAEINAEAEQLAGRKEEAAANVGLAGYGEAIKRAEDAFRINQENTAMRNKALGQIGTGVGYGLGTYLHSRSLAGPGGGGGTRYVDVNSI